MLIPRFALAALSLSTVLAAQERVLRVLELGGTPYERGQQHGEALRTQIEQMMRRWEQDIARSTKLEPDAFVARFLGRTGFEAAARKHTPELLDEVRGLAAGAGFSYERMLVYQLIDELWAMGHLAAEEKCSTIAADRHGDVPGFVAQNLDLPQWMHAHPTILRMRHPDRDLESFVVTMPGVVAFNGVNSRGVAVCVNTLLQLRPSPEGLPVAFVVRGLLAQESHAAALAFLHRVPHASGQAYTLGGPDHSPCFEASAGALARFEPPGCAGFTWHTNHPLVNRDWSPRHLERAAEARVAPEYQPRCPRFDSIEKVLVAGAHPSVDLAVQALSVPGLNATCNPGTYVCTVFVLGPEPELRIAPGKPDRTPLQVLRFAN